MVCSKCQRLKSVTSLRLPETCWWISFQHVASRNKSETRARLLDLAGFQQLCCSLTWLRILLSADLSKVEVMAFGLVVVTVIWVNMLPAQQTCLGITAMKWVLCHCCCWNWHVSSNKTLALNSNDMVYIVQENVQSGWLWKQGGIVRSWHRRYFIMKGDYIYYFGSDDDCGNGKPPLGSIFLPGNRIVEVPFSSGDAEKFQFEIQTGLSVMLLRLIGCWPHKLYLYCFIYSELHMSQFFTIWNDSWFFEIMYQLKGEL